MSWIGRLTARYTPALWIVVVGLMGNLAVLASLPIGTTDQDRIGQVVFLHLGSMALVGVAGGSYLVVSAVSSKPTSDQAARTAVGLLGVYPLAVAVITYPWVRAGLLDELSPTASTAVAQLLLLDYGALLIGALASPVVLLAWWIVRSIARAIWGVIVRAGR